MEELRSWRRTQTKCRVCGASVCGVCGATTLAPDVAARLQQTIWANRRPARILETPVYEFA